MNLLVKMKFGSHLYGTSTPESDTDYKGIYIPTAREIVLGSYARTVTKGRSKAEKERNTKDDVDEEIFSLDRFLELLMDGQTVALDMLFSPDFKGDEHGILREIYENRSRLLTKNVNAFVGYSRQQASKYGIKGSRMDALKQTLELFELFDPNLPLEHYPHDLAALVERTSKLVSLEKAPLIEILLLKAANNKHEPHLSVCGKKIPFHAKVGYARGIFNKIYQEYGARAQKAHLDGGKDWKALSHAVRVSGEALELLKTGHITFPRPDAALLLKIKKGQVDYDEVAHMIEQGLVDLTEAQKTSTLRAEPDKQWVEDLVARVYTKTVIDSNLIIIK